MLDTTADILDSKLSYAKYIANFNKSDIIQGILGIYKIKVY